MTILNQMLFGQAPSLVPLTVEQYHRMIAQGILREGDSIELIDGLLVRKDRADQGGDPMSHGPRHASGVKRLQRPFRQLEEHGYHLHSQLPVTLSGTQEPEPDLAIVHGLAADFDRRLPEPADIAAIMEVSDSSLTFDRTTKQRLYAAAAIPIYWIVNLVDRQIEVYSDPKPADGIHATRTDYRPGQIVKLPLGMGVEVDITVAELIPA